MPSSKKPPGLQFWVHIGGFSILDGANVSNISTTFVVYKDWKERGTALDQDRIVSSINRELAGIQEALAFVVIPPPIRGLGQTGGFQMMVEDRRSLGLAELQQAAHELVQAGNSQPSLRGLATTFSVSSPQLYLNIDRTKAESLQVPLSNVFDTLQAYLGSSFVNLFNKFNQVFQVYIQADNRYRLQPRDIKNLYVRNQKGEMVPLGALLEVKQIQGSELITRYNLYPAAAIFGSAAPGFSSGQALSLMEQLAADTLARGHGLRLDLHELPGKTGRLPGLLHICHLHYPGIHGAGRSVRELDLSRGGHPGRPRGPGGGPPGPHQPRLRQQPVHSGGPGA